ncbi:MAG: class I SAM-dependent methyltransferase [Pseudomonadota bacterium]|nr:class I SAM-dependent methyltransferase [Pseudomonadota bacterium]
MLTPEMVALKARLKETWMAGDYGHFAQYLAPGALDYFSRLDIKPGTRVLDLCCGAGQIAIPAARAGAEATGIDIADNLIEQARQRAADAGVAVRFEVADAEQLPFADAAFDLVVSLIGAMFAPRPERVVAEMIRVCRPGGRIAMANWTPEGHVGQMFRVLAKHVPPPATLPSPMKWGDEGCVRERFGQRTSKLTMTRRLYPIRYPFPPADVVEFFFEFYGPMLYAMAALDASHEDKLRKDLTQLWSTNNKATDGTTFVEAEYLEVTTRRN